MLDRRCSKPILAACGFALAAFCPDAGAYAVQAARSGFVLTSTTFRDGGPLPQRAGFTIRVAIPFDTKIRATIQVTAPSSNTSVNVLALRI